MPLCDVSNIKILGENVASRTLSGSTGYGLSPGPERRWRTVKRRFSAKPGDLPEPDAKKTGNRDGCRAVIFKHAVGQRRG